MSPPYSTPFIQHSQQLYLSHPHQHLNPISMAFPDDGANIHPYPSIVGNFDVDSDLDLRLTAGDIGIPKSFDAVANHWDMSGLPYPMLYPWASAPILNDDGEDFDHPLVMEPSDFAVPDFTNGHLYPDQNLPRIQAQPQLEGFPGWDHSFIPAPSNSKDFSISTPLRNQMLTNHGQCRLDTWETIRAGPPSTYST